MNDLKDKSFSDTQKIERLRKASIQHADAIFGLREIIIKFWEAQKTILKNMPQTPEVLQALSELEGMFKMIDSLDGAIKEKKQ